MPLLRRETPPPVVLTASGKRILNPADTKSKAPDAASLFDLYHRLGAIRAAMQMKYTAASKITYYPAVKEDPASDPVPVDDGPAVEAYERIRGEAGTFPDFVAELCMQEDVVGEGYLVGLQKGDEEEWDVWSAIEYEKWRKENPAKAKRLDDGDLENATELFYRIWRRDPERGDRPDSPLRAVAPECEQYILFRDVLTSAAQSRLIQPLLAVSNTVDFPRDPNKPEQTFGDWMLDAIITPVQDPRSAGRIAPIMLEVPNPGEFASVIDLTRDLPEWITEVMNRVLRQMAIGLDMPSDILAGVADVNHWSAWLIDDGLRLNYVDPMVLNVLGSLSRAYLQPALEGAVENPEDYVFWRDYSDLTSRAVGAADAFGAYDRGAITTEALRRTIGFTEDDAPEVMQPAASGTTEMPATSDTVQPGIPGEAGASHFQLMGADEISRLVNAAGILIRSGFDPEASLAAVGLPPIEHLGLLPVTVKDNSQEVIQEAIAASATPVDREPSVFDVALALTALDPIVATPGPSLGQIDHRLYTQVSEAAQAAVDRVLERAGAKIRQHLRGNGASHRLAQYQMLYGEIDGVDNHDVGVVLGPSIRETLQLSDEELVTPDLFERFGARVEKILTQGQDDTYRAVQEMTGATPVRDEEQERSFVAAAVSGLIAGLVAFGLRRLFTPTLDPDPAETGEVTQTEIPAALVWDTLTVAGGAEPATGPDQPRGLANGAQTERWIVEVGFQVEERVWTVGAPALPFEPHQRLSGTRFTQWTAEQLKTPLSASWIGVDYMFPGDHRGCQCVAELVVAEAEAVAA